MNYAALLWIFTISMGVAMLALPRKWAVAPFLLGIFVLPVSQSFVIAGLNFPSTRVLILIGLLGVAMKSSGGFKLNTIDKVVVLWVLTAIAAHSLLWGTSGALINRLGYGFDILGTYTIVRLLVNSLDDIERAVTVLAGLVIFIGACMLVEKAAGRNLFSIFGGVPAVPEFRMGRFRCQGPFRHPIMAGIFGASCFPLCLGLYWAAPRRKALALLGAAGATVITIAAASSDPLGAYMAGVVALFMWPLRGFMRLIRWGSLGIIVLLQIFMKSNVWDLIGRVSLVNGSTAYHRAVIVDAFIDRFDEWWLFGTQSTAHWAAKFLVPTDLTNQFVRVGVDGGIFTLGLFIAVIALCFRAVGRARKDSGLSHGEQRMCWAFGAALLVHLVAFIGASYWDQVIYALYLTFALVGSLSSFRRESPAVAPARIPTLAEAWSALASEASEESLPRT
jgi:hypothetical protein